MLVESQNYLELQYTSVLRILTSSELNITSELEIYNAVNKWLSYNIEERSKFAKVLSQTVRLSSLSDHASNYVLDQSSSIYKIDKCVEVLKKSFYERDSLYQNKISSGDSDRYCNQESFNIIVCRGHNTQVETTSKNVEFNAYNVGILNIIPIMTEEEYCSEAVCIKGEVYVFGVCYENFEILATSVEKYSHSTNT